MPGKAAYPNPADHPEAEPFLRAIAASPGDGLPRLQFSDWLEERGYDAEAKAQRWAAKNDKHPLPPTPVNRDFLPLGYPVINALNASGWFGSSGGADNFPHQHAVLPPEVWQPTLPENNYRANYRDFNRSFTNMLLSHNDQPVDQRQFLHEKAFLNHSRFTHFNDKGEPTLDQ